MNPLAALKKTRPANQRMKRTQAKTSSMCCPVRRNRKFLRRLPSLRSAQAPQGELQMPTRRDFLATAPLSLAGVALACRISPSDADSSAIVQAGAGQSAQPPSPLRAPPPDAPVLNWIPKHEDL